MPEVVELREVTDRRDVIHRAVHSLSAGELVILPSEAGTVIAGFALDEDASLRLSSADSPLVLLLRSSDEIADYLPHLAPVGFRFARRCWPGPLVLRTTMSTQGGFFSALPAATQSTLITDGEVSVRVSSHPVLSEVGKLLRGPLVIRELSEFPTAEELAQPQWQHVGLVVKESGTAAQIPPPPSPSSTTTSTKTSIVRINADGWSPVRIGLLNENKLQVSACELIVFVCTGNTCRSPMAEALFRDMLAKRLGCSVEDLTKRGFVVASAGLAADYGSPASPESVEMMRRRGLDIRAHASQPLTDRLLEQADRCYTLTNQHRNLILGGHPESVGRVQVLARDGKDISDPIGGGWNHYAACAESIEQHLAKILDELV